MGLSNSTYGLYGGFLTFTLPQLLAEQHLPEARIAIITAAVTSPGLWAFLFSPMLDVRFSRRWYATFFAALAAILLALSTANLKNTLILEGGLLAGFAAACLSTSALGGWLSSVTAKQDETRLSSWFNVANIGSGGVMALCGAEITHLLPLNMAALFLGAAVLLPASIFLLIPAPGPDRRLAKESFPSFFREVFALLGRRQVLVALLLFAAPASTFALTNVLGAQGDDFHCSTRFVSLVGGVGMTAAGILGSLFLPLLAKRFVLRPLYLGIGIAGSLFTLALINLPFNPAAYTIAFVGENVFQALAYTAMFAIIFETIGQDNPLAATTFSLLNAAAILPLVYMQVIDGWAYTKARITGSYLADASLSIAACILLAALLAMASKPRPKKKV